MKYVGQTTRTIQRRWAQHTHKGTSSKPSKGGVCPYLHNAITKYGKDSFTIEVLETVSSREELNAREEHWIKTLNTMAPNGYNLKPGGNQSEVTEATREKLRAAKKGFKHSPEVVEVLRQLATEQMKDPERRAHLSQINTGKRQSEESKRKKSLASKGRKLTPEHRQKLSEARKGMKFSDSHRASISAAKLANPSVFSDEARAAISRAHKGKGKPISDERLERQGQRWFEVYSRATGELIGTWINMQKCAEDLGKVRSQISDWLAGKTRSTQYTLKYRDDRGEQ